MFRSMINLFIIHNTVNYFFQENECVVAEALEYYSSTFHLAHILPEWRNRGLPIFSESKELLAYVSYMICLGIRPEY